MSSLIVEQQCDNDNTKDTIATRKSAATIATGVIFTKQDEENERKNLTLDEVISIDNDVYGYSSNEENIFRGDFDNIISNNNHHYRDLVSLQEAEQQQQEQQGEQQHEEDTATITTSTSSDNNNNIDENDDEVILDQLENEISSLPPENTQAYLCAMDICPDLVVTESNPYWFIRCNDGNLKKAASLLASYWELRVELFNENAFQPMNLHGALAGDVTNMMKLSPNMLRIIPTDVHGRTVVCGNVNNCDFSVSGNDRLLSVRYVWYVLHIALQIDTTIDNGLVVINVDTNKSSLGQFDRIRLKYLLESLRNAFPIKVKCIHLISSSIVNYYLPQLKAIMTNFLRQRVIVHDGNNINDNNNRLALLSSLENVFGIGLNMDYSYLDGSDRIPWLHERLIIEGIDISNVS